MALFERFSKKSQASRDASEIYYAVMQASRNPDFFGSTRLDDSYEGRLDVLALHLSGLYSALRENGEQGRRLAQAVYDVMVDDFDAALREEGLTDSGVKRRIKLMVAYVFGRIKEFDDFQSTYPQGSYQVDTSDMAANFPIQDIKVKPFIDYMQEYRASMGNMAFSELASGQIKFPEFSADRE